MLFFLKLNSSLLGEEVTGKGLLRDPFKVRKWKVDFPR